MKRIVVKRVVCLVVVFGALNAAAAWLWFLSGAEFKRGPDTAFLEALFMLAALAGTLIFSAIDKGN